jgi:hypothetical protein
MSDSDSNGFMWFLAGKQAYREATDAEKPAKA